MELHAENTEVPAASASEITPYKSRQFASCASKYVPANVAVWLWMCPTWKVLEVSGDKIALVLSWLFLFPVDWHSCCKEEWGSTTSIYLNFDNIPTAIKEYSSICSVFLSIPKTLHCSFAIPNCEWKAFRKKVTHELGVYIRI